MGSVVLLLLLSCAAIGLYGTRGAWRCQRCPWCRSVIAGQARVCPYCTRKVQPTRRVLV